MHDNKSLQNKDQLAELVRFNRQAMGLSQSDLAFAAHLSLPFVQLIEKGSANPSFDSLLSVLSVLGISLRMSSEVNWSLLARHGLATQEVKLQNLKPSQELLVPELSKACLVLIQEKDTSTENLRRFEATQALVLALRDGYPSWFKKTFRKKSCVVELIPKQLTGRLIKLRRYSLALLAEYM